MHNHQVNLPASKYLITFILLNHFLAAIVAMGLPLELSYRVLACVACAMSLSYWLKRYYLQQGHKAIVMLTQAHDHWQLLAANGKVHNGKLLPTSVVTPWLLVLHFQTEKQHRLFVPILQDMVSAAQMRQLYRAIRFPS